MLTSIDEENKIAFITCIEVVLMRRGNANYNSVLAKLKSKHGYEMNDILDHLDYLKIILKEVYKHEYNTVLDEISLETDRLEDMDEFKADFFKFMNNP